MGTMRLIVVTGAGGYLGRACVAEARRQGLFVLALHRSRPDPAWSGDARVQALQGDLTDPEIHVALQELPNDTAFIHAAGHMGDDPKALALDTISATAFLPIRQTQRLVLISSLAVYDTDRLSPGDTLNEASPLLPVPVDWEMAPTETIRSASSPYAMAKRLQETVHGPQAALRACWVLRPGAIWGPGRSWHALQGFWAGKLHVTIGSDGALPLAHLDNVAQAAVTAALRDSDGCEAINVFDDDCPTRARFLQAHRAAYGWPRLNVTIPYTAWAAAIRPCRPFAHRLPGLFRETTLRARMMPIRCPNTRLRQRLGGGQPGFETLLADARRAES
ncbi:NAD-dependent epimerase/dehydratase family protein [Pseudoponticoccus marisrubri]|nr:NAD(P)-dependent oxidoreductase [Pseudoponticoccus marisrubri]